MKTSKERITELEIENSRLLMLFEVVKMYSSPNEDLIFSAEERLTAIDNATDKAIKITMEGKC